MERKQEYLLLYSQKNIHCLKDPFPYKIEDIKWAKRKWTILNKGMYFLNEFDILTCFIWTVSGGCLMNLFARYSRSVSSSHRINVHKTKNNRKIQWLELLQKYCSIVMKSGFHIFWYNNSLLIKRRVFKVDVKIIKVITLAYVKWIPIKYAM